MKLVRENIKFERGQKPMDSMEIGDYDGRKMERAISQLKRMGAILATKYFNGNFEYEPELNGTGIVPTVYFHGKYGYYFLKYYGLTIDYFTFGYGNKERPISQEWILSHDLNLQDIENYLQRAPKIQ